MWSFTKDGGTAQANQFCDQHGSPFSLYCMDDEKLVCSSCRLGSEHTGHDLVAVQQAAPVLKKIVGDSRGTLTKKLEGHEEARLTLNTMSRHVKSQAQQTEREIKDEFEKLHRFLREEEEARIAAMKKEEKQKSQMMKQRIEKITMEMSFIANTISTIEKELQAEDISFLQGYSQTIKRIWQSLQDPQSSGMFSSGVTQLINRMKTSFSTPGQIHNDTLTRIYGTPPKPEPITNGLIDVAKHLGNLKYRVWEKMLGTLHYTLVTLDPNTATPCLSLSRELTTMKFCTDNPQLPDNPERFTFGAKILGSQGFTSGIHRWDVEVGDNSNWAVGVATQPIERKGETTGQVLALYNMNGHYHTTGMGLISVRYKLRRVRVELDWNRGNVTFSDPGCSGPITAMNFSHRERLFPYFQSLCEEHPLQISPDEVSITIEAPNFSTCCSHQSAN
ncbi:E3 ubiquitin-protein ligase TRIM35-like [Conger conger]|uniref:E3 ubiquitin-protein ligase TRIM35-like n=1 Tax=Conger conger TaxID=82655 RepID=UPI002A59C70D|nr:E3 ubiquitin-protein ligase TRIM35-like [Conger conger]